MRSMRFEFHTRRSRRRHRIQMQIIRRRAGSEAKQHCNR